MDKRPINPEAHGAIDYGFLGLMMAGPTLLDLPPRSRWMFGALGLVQGTLNAMTDQPLALKRAVPFRTHGRIELASGSAFVALPLIAGAIQTPRSRAFFLMALASLATVYRLTDWDATPSA